MNHFKSNKLPIFDSKMFLDDKAFDLGELVVDGQKVLSNSFCFSFGQGVCK